ncbi:hypothetical protein H8711_03280 [Clostridiaceae bacterium NSJ-31]|uniref:Uncharacterized protein n=1 Tax=Ligaoa zhengdingensis TaxID=2763658 RepID=A0A926DYK6_9FIRM|nr:hypothetical protein [Ligaoa zhengdingensis]MBC8545962.1 hypothetical protein [Ligaoa zhengdingensis]
MLDDDFFEVLRANNIPEFKVSINNAIKDDVYCIRENYNQWEVFYRERGKEFNLKKFDTKEEAQNYLLNYLIRIR